MMQVLLYTYRRRVLMDETLTETESSRLARCRRSHSLAVCVVYCAFVVDSALTSSVEANLPCVLVDIEYGGHYPYLKDICHTEGDTQYVLGSGNRTLTEVTSFDTGLILAVKPITEIGLNIVVGFLLEAIGHRYLLAVATVISAAATIALGYLSDVTLLLVARVIQGVGSSLTFVLGLHLVSSLYEDDKKRARMLSVCMTGTLAGTMLGWPIGSILYEWGGRSAPYLCLACLLALDGAARLFINPVGVKTNKASPFQSAKEIFTDPGILLTVLAIFGPSVMVGVFLTLGPGWMIGTLGARQWQVGVIMLIIMAASFVVMINVHCIPIPRYILLFLAQVLSAVAAASLPFCHNIWAVLGPNLAFIIAHSCIMATVSPMLARQADLRHNSSYVMVFALYEASINIALVLGPLSAGFSHSVISLDVIFYSTAAFIFLMSFLSIPLKGYETNIYDRVV